MSKTAVVSDLPEAVIVNSEGEYAKELQANLIQYGIPTELVSQESLKTYSQTHEIGYIAWFTSDNDEIQQFNQYLNLSQWRSCKWLLITALDAVKPNLEDVLTYEQELTKLWSGLVIQSRTSGLDLRILGISGMDSPQLAMGEIGAQISSGSIAKHNRSTLGVTHPVAFAQTTCSIWFDRGHRHQAVVYQTLNAPSYNDIAGKIIEELPNLKSGETIGEWGCGERITGAEAVQVPSLSPADIIDRFKQHVVAPPKLSPPPLSKPRPHQEISNPFRAVIVDENPAPLPVSHVSAPTPALISPHKPPPPLVTKLQPVSPVVPVPAPLHVREVVQPKKPKTVTLKTSRRMLIGLLLVFFLIFIGGGGIYLSLHPVISLQETSDQQALDRAASASTGLIQTLQTLPLDSISPLNSLKTGFLNYLRQREALATKIKADRLYAEGVRRMVTADQQDPYEALQQAKLTYDQLYMHQTVYNTSALDQGSLQARRNMVNLLPHLIPGHKKTLVMVLLQNNLELRPTGGFIGSVVLMTFDHGKLINTETRDIYDLDSNLKGSVTPPAEITSYLGESNWFFRDANWAPDFNASAQQANWFLDKELARQADIIIGVNGNTFQNILAATGPIALGDGQVIGADNLLVSAYNHQDSPSTKPEANKQEFFSLLVKPVLDKLMLPPSDQSLGILAALELSAQNQDLTLAATDTLVQSRIYDSNWGGLASAQTCPATLPEPCLPESLLINEANIGINKTNFHISRSRSHSLTVNNNQVNHSHTITYTNASPTEAWPGGTYKAYIRAILPANASISSINIDNQALSAAAYTQSRVGSLTQVAFSIEVKPQARKTVSISYTTPKTNEKSLNWTLIKQPGQSEDDLTLEVGRGNVLLGNVSSSLSSNTNNSFTGKLNKNAVITIEFLQ